MAPKQQYFPDGSVLEPTEYTENHDLRDLLEAFQQNLIGINRGSWVEQS